MGEEQRRNDAAVRGSGVYRRRCESEVVVMSGSEARAVLWFCQRGGKGMAA